MQAAQKMIVEDFGMTETIKSRGKISRADVMAEIRHHLAPFQTDGRTITGDTVISKDLAIDSLAVMDMVMELEDRFDVTISMNLVAEIHTVDQLADTILMLRAKR